MSIVILNARARQFEARADAPMLSLKCMLRGEARYALGRREVMVGHGQCLLLNQGTPYRITINSAETVESFVVFFDPDWVQQAWRALTTKESMLLDDPSARSRANGPRFDETLQPLDGHLDALRDRLQTWHRAAVRETHAQDELARDLLMACLRRQGGLERSGARLGAQRISTREELRRRLQIARDYLWSNLAEDVTVDDVARAAGLSPFHLSREFRVLFGRAPIRYLQELRINRALSMLRQSDRSVLEICQSVGFESPTTFSALVKRRTGRGPRAWRRG